MEIIIYHLSSDNTPNRIVGLYRYKIEYGKNVKAATSINLGYIGEQASPITYAYGGDMNGDGFFNDLLFIPNNGSDILFQRYY
jgi:hypothetical protein